MMAAKKESGMYIDGVKQGSWKGWFKNGQKKFVLIYKNNFKHGLYTEWGNDGRLRKDIEYNEGSPISEYIVEYSGEGYTEINRRNGELSGSWIKWYSNGKKSEEGVYKYGEKGVFGQVGMRMRLKNIKQDIKMERSMAFTQNLMKRGA